MHRFLFILLSLSSLAAAAPSVPEVAAVEQALRDQLPEVALAKLERLLATPKLPDEVLQAAQLLVVESAVRAGKPARGLELTEQVAMPHPPELVFWRAAALQALGQYRAALTLLEGLPAETEASLLERAKFNRASLLMGLGDAAEAVTVLKELALSGDAASSQRAKLWLAEAQLQMQDLPAAQTTLNSVEAGAADVQKMFLLGKLEFAQGHGAAAAQWFGQVVSATVAAARPLHLPALLGLARSQRMQGQKGAAARTLAELIASSAEVQFIEPAFQEFRLANTPPDAELEKLLLGWSNSTDPTVAAPALLALIEAREVGGKPDEALQLCATFVGKYSSHPLMVEVLLRQSRMLITQGKGDVVVQMLAPLQQPNQAPQVQAWAAEVLGYGKLRAGNFAEAIKAFKLVTDKTPEPEKKLLAKYQAALASIQASAPEAMPDLSEVKLSPSLEADLQLERGLYAASKAAPGTESFLETFLRLHSEHPRAFAAALALAEYSLPKASSAPEVMRRRLERATQLAKADVEKEQVTRLSLHFDSLTAAPDVFAKKVEEYLASHPPGSKNRAEVLFKLAERLHNAGQSAAAKARFLQLVKEEPDAEEVEMALFYAGKAALGSQAEGREDEAMKLWDQVARGKGPLRFYARLEQGKLDQRRSPKAAPQIFDSIIKAVPPPEPSLIYQALCLRGETQLALSLDNPALAQDAMKSFDEVLNSPTASVTVKQQAQVRKGDGFLRLKQERAALEAYYDAMNLTQMGTTAASKDVDYFWFFRAGEKAMLLLEGKQDWKAAVAIAQKLADAPGPRGDIAREHANRLITEHYLWQDE